MSSTIDLRLVHIWASGNIDIFEVIAKELKTGAKVKNYIQFQKISILVGPLKCVDITTTL